MAYSIRELILQQVQAQLEATQAGEDEAPAVGRSPSTAAESAVLPRHDVLLAAPPNQLGETVDNGWAYGDQVGRKLIFAVASRYAAPYDGTPLDQVGDPLTVRAVRAILDGSHLGGLVVDITEIGTDWRTEAADVRYGDATIYFEALYETKRSDPTTAPD